MKLDHVVLWVSDALASVEWYGSMLGMEGVRVDEYRAGTAPFPSVRVNEDTIIDLSPMDSAPGTENLTKVGGSAGHQVNHVCVAVDRREFDRIEQVLKTAGVDTSARQHPTYGARAWAPDAFYCHDPDGNVIEVRRYYDERDAGESLVPGAG